MKPAPKIFKEDCKIDWSEPIEKIHNKIRGLSPYPAAWTNFIQDNESKSVKIYKGYFEHNQENSDKPGQIKFEKNQIKILLSDGIYYVEELQPEGKKRMTDKDFINGLQDKSDWKIS